MNTIIKTAFAAIIFLVVSCKKENNTLRSSLNDKGSTAELINDSHEPGKYASVVIGTQKWMTKNLDVTHYRNGDKIPQVKDNAKWAALTTGAWCRHNNDSVTSASYGKLYNWYAVNDPRGLAPTGWHVASDAEWDTLTTFLGTNAGGKLKDTGTIGSDTGLWYAPNGNATNETGFTALPGGLRHGNGTFRPIGFVGYWWSSSTEHSGGSNWSRLLNCYNGHVSRSINYNRSGYSVRCVKD